MGTTILLGTCPLLVAWQLMPVDRICTGTLCYDGSREERRLMGAECGTWRRMVEAKSAELQKDTLLDFIQPSIS